MMAIYDKELAKLDRENLAKLVAQRTNELVRANRQLSQQINERRRAEEMLREQKETLENKNIALKELTEQIEIEKREMQRKINANVNTFLLPLVEKLKLRMTLADGEYLQLLEQNLKELTSGYGGRLHEFDPHLTRREIDICNMVKHGLTSKEIAKMLAISEQTVAKHRQNIRKKLKIDKKQTNLATYIQKIG